jgi:crotonobetainyl-CoA:carnitine CoA-transferase CaiB-like acyl-CoA transferase
MTLLSDIRVLDFSTGIAGAYASKLFADFGSDVVKVEPPDGDPLRRRQLAREQEAGEQEAGELEQGDAALFRFLSRGKRSVVGSPADPGIASLAARADLVVESFAARQFDPPSWLARHPGVVVLSISPYGRTGPWVERPATEFVVQAEAGSTACRSRPDREPVHIGGQMSEWLAGLYGAAGALAALRKARRTGVGEHVDASLFAAINYSAAAQTRAKYETQKVPGLDTPFRFLEVPSIEPTRDGYVGFNTNTRQQFENFLILIERPDLLADERWTLAGYRSGHLDEWNEIVHAWTTRRTSAEIVELASLLRIPVAPVNDASQVLKHEQFAAREFFRPSYDGQFVEPSAPFKVDGMRPQPDGPSPALGTAQARAVSDAWLARGPRVDYGDPGLLALSDLRILDATAWWAGPVVGQAFAALGAQVIHLESAQHPDNMRFTVGPLGTTDRWWERGYLFLGNNWNKQSLAVDLGSDEGLQIVRSLIAKSDVLIENFSPRVFESFGLDREAVLKINPGIIFVRMPAFGLNGPWRNNVGFAQTMEQMTGLAWITGPPGQPTIPRGPCDPAAGFHAFFAALAALHRRDLTGRGAFIESAMCEAVVALASEMIIEYTAHGQVLKSDGNRGPDAAPQGLYRCEGPDNWIAIAIETDEQWLSFVAVLGCPSWALRAEFRTTCGRRQHQDELDVAIAQWARDQEARVAADTLVAYGVPAGCVVDPRLAHEHPQFQALGYFEQVAHEVAGQLTIAALPFRYGSVTSWIRRPAPLLGQDNEEVLTSLLGLDAERIAALTAAGVLGTVPLNL